MRLWRTTSGVHAAYSCGVHAAYSCGVHAVNRGFLLHKWIRYTYMCADLISYSVYYFSKTKALKFAMYMCILRDDLKCRSQTKLWKKNLYWLFQISWLNYHLIFKRFCSTSWSLIFFYLHSLNHNVSFEPYGCIQMVWYNVYLTLVMQYMSCCMKLWILTTKLMHIYHMAANKEHSKTNVKHSYYEVNNYTWKAYYKANATYMALKVYIILN